MSSIKYIHNSDEANILLIFVHGFNGGNKTFINENNFHLFSLMPDEIKNNCACINFNYRSTFFDFSQFYIIFSKIPLLKKILKPYGNRSINDCSRLLSSYCSTFAKKYRKIVLLGHSMGGVIARKAIIHLENDVPSYETLLITFATPHQGNYFANTASIVFKNKQLQNLGPLSDVICDIDREWTEINPNSRCHYFSGHDDNIVPDLYSKPRSAGENTIRVDGDHQSLVKPSTGDDLIVAKLTEIMKEFSSSEDDLIQSQSNSLFLSYTKNNEKFYLKRSLDNDFEWKLKANNILIYGDSGTGKTVSAQRNILTSGNDIHYIDLSPINDYSRNQIVHQIIRVLNRNSLKITDTEYDLNTIVKIILRLCKKNKQCTQCILLDEVHFSSQEILSDIFSLVTIITSMVSKHNLSNVKFIITMPLLSKIENLILKDKSFEFFQIIRMVSWTREEISSLLEIILKDLDRMLTNTERQDVIVASNGSPRRLKKILSNYKALDGYNGNVILRAITDMDHEGVYS
jgi:hypothetical protein